MGDPEAPPPTRSSWKKRNNSPSPIPPPDEINQFFRGLSSLATASFVIESLKEVPGHKNLVIISGGIPIFSAGTTGSAFTNTTYMLNRLSDAAIRAGVVISALDPRGMRATPGVVGFSWNAGSIKLPVRNSWARDWIWAGWRSRYGGLGPMLAGGGEALD